MNHTRVVTTPEIHPSREFWDRVLPVAPYLDFRKIESREVSLDWVARKQIYLACEDFLSSARMYDYASPIDAEAARNKARDLCKSCA